MINLTLAEEVVLGLSKYQKTIPPKFLYDKEGSQIFEKICELPEYYPTRAEKEILVNNAKEIASMIGPEALIIEPGSGSGEKIRLFLNELVRPVGYLPIEISEDALTKMAKEITHDFPKVKVIPLCADFTQGITLPNEFSKPEKKVIFFPGSTIGNFSPDEAVSFMKMCGSALGPGDGFLVGVDTKKDSKVLKRAYNDSQGVTAAFNLNLLKRLNKEINSSFDTDRFQHEAVYNPVLGRVEMHLRSKSSQIVRVHKRIVRFYEGETIHTENSYKYNASEFCELASKAKFKLKKMWLDSNKQFAVYYFNHEGRQKSINRDGAMEGV